MHRSNPENFGQHVDWYNSQARVYRCSKCSQSTVKKRLTAVCQTRNKNFYFFFWFAVPRPRRCQTTNKTERKWDIFKRKIMMRDRPEKKKEKNFWENWKIRPFRWGSGLYRLVFSRPFHRRCGHLPPRKRPTNQRENIGLSRVFQIIMKESEKFLDPFLFHFINLILHHFF